MAPHPNAIEIPSTLPVEGVSVPVRAAFAGIRGIPWLALGHNSVNPRLDLYEDRVDVRLFRRRAIPYADVRRAGVSTTGVTRCLELEIAGSLLTFAARLADDETLSAVLRAFAARGVPLSDGARAWLADR